MKKVLTLAYLISNEAICLAMKKRGFGAGKWNGFGGKVEEGESIEDSAVREIEEESGVRVKKEELEKVAILEFFFKDGTHLEVHAFFIREWEGNPEESEEMRPAWFLHHQMPFENMWADDPYWLARTLRGERLKGVVKFKADGSTIEDMTWEHVASF